MCVWGVCVGGGGAGAGQVLPWLGGCSRPTTTTTTPPATPLPPPPHCPHCPPQLRKLPILEALHEFMKRENETGSITRQEAVSMVPPLFMDVKVSRGMWVGGWVGGWAGGCVHARMLCI